jgi:hypothetical protein
MPIVSFHRTAAGYLAARLDGYCMMAVPGKTGFSVFGAYSIDRAPEDWGRSDFYVAGKSVESEEAFMAHARELAQDKIDRTALHRTEVIYHGQTPWGPAQVSTRYGDGVVFHATAGHGGFDLDETARAEVDPRWGVSGRFFEEDADWAIVAVTFPHLFTVYERKCAIESLRNWRPDGYEAVLGVTLDPGESWVKDERQFHALHAHDWIVISAITSDHQSGFVECVATLGARHGNAPERRFLVPSDEYRPGPFGFVIDEARHASYDGPSSFIADRR